MLSSQLSNLAINSSPISALVLPHHSPRSNSVNPSYISISFSCPFSWCFSTCLAPYLARFNGLLAILSMLYYSKYNPATVLLIHLEGLVVRLGFRRILHVCHLVVLLLHDGHRRFFCVFLLLVIVLVRHCYLKEL